MLRGSGGGGSGVGVIVRGLVEVLGVVRMEWWRLRVGLCTGWGICI